jgi:drug/metabolite transporter (DMT)-like permease
VNDGIFLCILCSLLWSISSLFATQAIRSIGAQIYNCLRLTLGSLLLLLVFLVQGTWVSPSFNHWILLGISSFVGLSAGDLLLFRGFSILGARRANLIFMSNIPLTGVLAFFWFGETLDFTELLGGGITLTGIAIATTAQTNSQGARTQVDMVQGGAKKGVMLCLAAALCQSTGLLTLKPIFQSQQYDIIQIAPIRFIMGGAVTLTMACASGKLKEIPKNIGMKPWTNATLATLLGGVLGFLCYVAGISKVPASYGALLTSLSSLFLLPILVVFNQKWPPLQAWIGAILGILGVYLFVQA